MKKRDRTIKNILVNCIVSIITYLIINVMAYYFFDRDFELDIILIYAIVFLIISFSLEYPNLRRK
jgi:uncharacterized membrane protein (GlpM family)